MIALLVVSPAHSKDPSAHELDLRWLERMERARMEAAALGYLQKGTWPCRGGGPGRAGYTVTRPTRGPYREAWRLKVDGEIVGEALVYYDHIALLVQQDKKFRIWLIQLEDGRAKKSRTFRGVPAGLAMGPTWIVGTLGSDEFFLLRRTTKRFTTTIRRKLPMPNPAWSGDAVALDRSHWLMGHTVGTGPKVDTQAVDLLTQAERSESVSGFARNVAVFNGVALTVAKDARANFLANYVPVLAPKPAKFDEARFDREGGFVGSGAEAPATKGAPGIAWLGGLVVVRPPLALGLAGGGFANTIVQRAGRPDFLGDLLELPVTDGVRWIGRGDLATDDQALAMFVPMRNEKLSVQILARSKDRPDLYAAASRLTLARDVLYAGRHVIDLGRSALLPELPFDPVRRVVPAQRALLAMPDSSTLVCLRQDDGTAPDAPPLFNLLEQASGDALLLLKDGDLHEGPWSTKPKPPGAPKPPKGTKATIYVAPEDVALALTADGHVARARSVAGGIRSLRILAAKRVGMRLATLALKALQAKNLDLATSLIRAIDASDHGDLLPEKVRARYEKTLERGMRGRPDKKRSAKIREAATAARAGEIKTLFNAIQPASGKAPWPWRRAILRETLLRNPRHEGARELVRAALPKAIEAPPYFEALKWLPLADVATWTTVEPAPEDEDTAYHLRMAKRAWRPDLRALGCGPLLAVTPVARPHRIAAALGAGHLLMKRLEALLGPSRDPMRAKKPIPMHIFEDAERYASFARKLVPGGISETLAKSLGHYTPNADISRLYLPEVDEPGPFYWSTFLHELTHHWCDRHLRAGGGGAYGNQSGYWVCEGIAEAMAETPLDLTRRTFLPIQRAAHTIEVVGNAKAEHLLPWKTLYTASQYYLREAEQIQPVNVPLRWRLGWRRKVDGVGRFYAQSAVTALYLLNEHPGGPEVLKQIVCSYYDGSYSLEHLEKLTGLTAKALGQKVRAYAVRVNRSSQ